jgi:hypothetical protein
MVEEGILGDDEPTQLIEGELVVTPPQGPTQSWPVVPWGLRPSS